MKLLLPVLLALCICSPVKAAECSDLAHRYRHYEMPNDSPNKVFANSAWYLGYLTGYVESALTGGYDRHNFDVPEGVRAEQLAGVVGKWLQEHPQHWHESAASCVETALASVWRSSKQN